MSAVLQQFYRDCDFCARLYALMSHRGHKYGRWSCFIFVIVWTKMVFYPNLVCTQSRLPERIFLKAE